MFLLRLFYYGEGYLETFGTCMSHHVCRPLRTRTACWSRASLAVERWDERPTPGLAEDPSPPFLQLPRVAVDLHRAVLAGTRGCCLPLRAGETQNRPGLERGPVRLASREGESVSEGCLYICPSARAGRSLHQGVTQQAPGSWGDCAVAPGHSAVLGHCSSRAM